VRGITAAFLLLALLTSATQCRAAESGAAPPAPMKQTAAEAALKSAGCMSCHTTTDSLTMHTSPGVTLGCADCHGGNAGVFRAAVALPTSAEYRRALDAAHVHPRYPEEWNYPSSVKPPRTYTLLNRESPEFIRFLNPSDYRVAREACGACHLRIIVAAERSLMATTAMFWAAGAYNNGILPFKHTIVGEAYTRDGQPAKLLTPVMPTPEVTRRHGIVPELSPLPSWEVFPPGDVFVSSSAAVATSSPSSPRSATRTRRVSCSGSRSRDAPTSASPTAARVPGCGSQSRS